MRILLTGAGGFIGSSLISQLSDHYTIFPVYRNKNNPLKRDILVDILNKEQVMNLFSSFAAHTKIDVIIHCASILASGQNLKDFSLLYDNLKISENIVEITKMLKPSKLINLSSMAVYPNIDGVFNEQSLVNPSANTDCVYGLSKFCSEIIFEYYLGKENIQVANLRLAQVYGKGMRNDRIISVMKKELAENNTISVYGNGERISNFIKVEKFAGIVKKIINEDIYGVYNVGDENMSYYHLAETIIKKHGNEHSQIKKINKGSKAKFFLCTKKLNNKIL
jgi:nucleoside-diphosphate-sugar epimerase